MTVQPRPTRTSNTRITPQTTGQPASATPTERDRELSELVDDLEERVAAEHEAQDVPGNAAERAHITPTDTGDDAPD